MIGKLYLVATPIGNLEDITFRAIKILKEVDLIAAEDTRHTLKLLNHYQISKPLISYHRHNEEEKSKVLIEKLLNGENIALVTDAGTPGISDPGEEIVKQAIKEDIEIIPIPGACAFVNALIVSGLSTNQFSFYGFLPLNKKLRESVLSKIKRENKTVVLYEAPHKLRKTLEDIIEKIGDINCVVEKELTKIHEEIIRGKISEILEKIAEPKGEFIILLEIGENEQDENIIKNKSIDEQYEFYKKQGMNKKEIIKAIAKNENAPKNEIYQRFINK